MSTNIEMPDGTSDPRLQNLVVRPYEQQDHDSVRHLYVNGLLAGQISANDTGADIENIQEAYFSDASSGFWVACNDGKLLGMIGVAAEGKHTAEIRRLRVDKQWQNSPIGLVLIERALAHCQRQGYLKVVLDTRFERDSALDMFGRFGFQHTRTRSSHGKDLLEFYLDLYRGKKDQNQPAHD